MVLSLLVPLCIVPCVHIRMVLLFMYLVSFRCVVVSVLLTMQFIIYYLYTCGAHTPLHSNLHIRIKLCMTLNSNFYPISCFFSSFFSYSIYRLNCMLTTPGPLSCFIINFFQLNQDSISYTLFFPTCFHLSLLKSPASR